MQMLAEMIRVERARRRVTQGELAQRLQTSQATLSRIEDGGPVREPRLLLALSDFLNLPVEDVVRAAVAAEAQPAAASVA